ncbi:MAG: TrbC/VirB2 family protein [Alphaproteobacteria bacterium]|nr:TrbC/VirB2 family protein [Rickettsiales bacterium]
MRLKNILSSQKLPIAGLVIFLNVISNVSLPYLSNISFADVIADDKIISANLPEIRNRRLVEDNGIAELLCKFIKLMQSDIARALLAYMLFSVGVGAFFGKLTIGWFLSFTVGVAVFFGSVSLLNFFAPYSNIGMGCECKNTLVIGRDSTGAYLKIPTMLDKNCKHLDDPNKIM